MGCSLQGGWPGANPACRISQMGELACALYTGGSSTTNVAVILPKNPDYLPAIWAFCQSPQFNEAVRRIDKKMNVTNATLVKVPFDLDLLASGRRCRRTAARTLLQRPDPVALQGPPRRLDRAAAGGRGPAARLPLARAGAGRPRPAGRRGRHRLPARRGPGGARGGAPARPAGRRLRRRLVAGPAGKPARRGRLRGQGAGRLAARRLLRPALRACSTTAPSSGTSGTATGTASPRWSTTTRWTAPASTA